MPVNVTLRVKVVAFLGRSRLAANSFPQTLQVCSSQKEKKKERKRDELIASFPLGDFSNSLWRRFYN
jgi:hypothetical protein